MDEKLAVVGLGYVGLPLAVAFGKRRPTIGYDVNEAKVATYRAGHDPTGEVTDAELAAARHLELTSDPRRLREAGIVIVAVPTPIDQARIPDLGPLRAASRTVGEHLRPGAVVVYESTVYPGCTEEVCVPILEQASGLRWREGFHVGYSPERINPGDREHRLETIVKVVAGDDEATLERVARLYGEVVEAGVHRASSIRVAEAAKVIENTQRDLNIALMNELAMLFDRMGLDTLEVLEAASTKWNFLPFRPGLVGGHCIGVDPYYLTYKAQTLGHHPEIILAGRRINDRMGKYVAEQTVKRLIRNGHGVRGTRVAVLGLTFKEDCPDLRNSKVVDVVRELADYGAEVVVHDPVADPAEARAEYGIELAPWEALRPAAAIVLAVPHRALRERAAGEFAALAGDAPSFIDVKSALDRRALEAAGFDVWRL
ncbi:nucleotide sugar dehydrogenase [Inmirania thermothiophila]|uniref:UDP-N-acetyl-D-galactosamine dehydrogenase n=1 Tax=Inmirania thermothiophila TaxID=1750597 RepID=A0A3N1XSM6_9GAMM|nr:nucleotide sugar dehydrogenase [Inmirania thermothiophila]ROR29650.1 UDP-N-acetyl-D-galactosamine dehydrogenase [Inmirania thermothiophila]